jgi:hypothetical protein
MNPRVPQTYEELPPPAAPPADPTAFAFPVTLPMELALGDSSAQEICELHGITRERFCELAQLPAFQKAYEDALVALSKEGMSFKVKARFMSEELLKTAWRLIHNQFTPSNVKADLIKSFWRVSGYEPKKDEAAPVSPLAIQINLNNG